ncbi:MAG: LamG-like jellyroll fold domain-containing protein [Planctomycetota bacterium]|jgi:hypothetical protein
MMCRKLSHLIVLVVALSVPSGGASAALKDGLLIWHDFENLVDGSGNGHDAALGGNAYVSDGLLWLDGNGDYADLGTVANFGPVNPFVDARSDFTIAIAYASTSTAGGAGGSILVSTGPAEAEGSGDFSLGTNDDGQYIDHWYTAAVESDQSGIGYADGTVHLVVVTYEQDTDTYSFYHIETGAAVTHGSVVMQDWGGEWDESLDYGIRLGSHRNATVRVDEGPGFFPDLDGQIDMFAIWDRALDLSEISHIPSYSTTQELAGDPSPGDAATDVLRDTTLSWKPGLYADTHNVYFGTDFDDVNDAQTDSILLASSGQTNASYRPDGVLDWGRTYYWRVDEVNAPPDTTVYKGQTWSFTVEPYVYPMTLGEHITAVTASSFDPKYQHINTINGSGLDADDLHDANEHNMWLSAKNASGQAWIQYEFDRNYQLDALLIWNYNRFHEDKLGYGFKEMLIEYSADGVDFAALDPIQLESATGKEPISPVTVALNGLVASHVRLKAVSNFMGRSQYGLSEVRLLYLPVRAREPEPTDGTEDVLIGSALSWRPGRNAETHDVLIGTAMDDLTLMRDDLADTSFTPDLVLSQTYYWQVLETDVAALAGSIWSFSTQEFLIVDDFESYNDIEAGQPGSDLIYETWLDGFGIPTNGSTIGYAVPFQPTMESDTVHGGRQSAPLMYDNSAAAFSEVTVNPAGLPIGPDWTGANVKALTVYVHGSEDNLGGQLYVKVNGVKQAQAADLASELWQEVNIDLASFGVNVENVTSLTIGIEGPGSSGLVFIDDVRLYPSRCMPEMVPGDLTGDCVVDAEDLAVITDNWLTRPLSVEYAFDSSLSDTSGNSRHGVGQNNPTVSGGILTLNGTNFVDIPLGADNPFDGSRDFSIAMDFRASASSILLSSARDNEPDNHSMSLFVHDWDEPFWSEVNYDNYSVDIATAEDDPLDGQWHNVVVTYDADGEWFAVYLDAIAGEGTQMNPAIPEIAADTVRIGGSLNTSYPYNEGVSDLVGDVDNIRIFNFTLTPEDVRRLPDVPTGPADLNGDGMVDQADKDIVEANMGPEKLWP